VVGVIICCCFNADGVVKIKLLPPKTGDEDLEELVRLAAFFGST